jgi:hypothetical protein
MSGVPGRARRRAAADRRRQNLTWLAGFIVITFLLGLIPALRFLLVINLVADILLIAYLGLAVYIAARPPTETRTRAAPPTPAYEPDIRRPEVAGGGL